MTKKSLAFFLLTSKIVIKRLNKFKVFFFARAYTCLLNVYSLKYGIPYKIASSYLPVEHTPVGRVVWEMKSFAFYLSSRIAWFFLYYKKNKHTTGYKKLIFYQYFTRCFWVFFCNFLYLIHRKQLRLTKHYQSTIETGFGIKKMVEDFKQKKRLSFVEFESPWEDESKPKRITFVTRNST